MTGQRHSLTLIFSHTQDTYNLSGIIQDIENVFSSTAAESLEQEIGEIAAKLGAALADIVNFVDSEAPEAVAILQDIETVATLIQNVLSRTVNLAAAAKAGK